VNPATCAANLECGTEYVFRVFGHATSKLKRSAYAYWTCSTAECDLGCDPFVRSQGYWKTHGPTPCDQAMSQPWPVWDRNLGTVTYTDAELCSILQQVPAGNGLVSLAHQLIATELNLANGAGDAYADAVDSAVAAAHACIGSLVVPPVGTDSKPGGYCSGTTAALDALIHTYECH
jgi:hypothetical protein